MAGRELRNPIKQTLKRLIIKARDRVLSLEDDQDKKPNGQHNHGQDDFAWPWLNALLTKLLTEAGPGLRPNYAWGVLQGAHLAKAIGINRVSVIEFGVAGGNGLISLEKAAERAEQILGVGIDVYGFDTGRGLPKPVDYRDCPNLWIETGFPMDVERLEKRLDRARLILGLVENTVPIFLQSNPAPVAFVSFDLDYYSSTMHAFEVLKADQALLLPRVHCYFDDILGFTYSDFTGERLAIHEFNNSQATRKISNIFALHYYIPQQYVGSITPEKQYMAHIFDHDLYCRHDHLVKRPFDGSTNLVAGKSTGKERSSRSGGI